MFGKILRIAGIVLLGITGVITVLSGIGTTCVALDAAKYEMDGITPFRWLYMIYVLAGIIIGGLGIRATTALIRSKPTAYRASIIALVLGLVTGGLHMATSRALRGSSMPVDFIVYATVITLVVFLLFRIPGVWDQINRTGSNDTSSGLGTGVTMIVGGIVILTVQYWAGPTHMINGVNYADVWHTQMAIVGGAATFMGAIFLLGSLLEISLPNLVKARRFREIKLFVSK